MSSNRVYFSYEDILAKLKGEDSPEYQQLKSTRDRLASRAKELENLPVRDWPELNIQWDTTPSGFRFALDGVSQKEFATLYPEGFIVRWVFLGELNTKLNQFNRREVDETWTIGFSDKLARVLAWVEDGQPLTPILVSPHSMLEGQVVLQGGNHRYAMVNALKLKMLPICFVPKDYGQVAKRLTLHSHSL